MFRGALTQRRCLVPADAFYEWRAMKDGKQPYVIARRDGQPMAFAGLWEGWRAPDGNVLRTYTTIIITTAANTTMAELHDRMPVILEAADWPTWLGEYGGNIAALLRPAGENVLRLVLTCSTRKTTQQLRRRAMCQLDRTPLSDVALGRGATRTKRDVHCANSR
jgi:putative SOS response-associated peptidase YedK